MKTRNKSYKNIIAAYTRTASQVQRSFGDVAVGIDSDVRDRISDLNRLIGVSPTGSTSTDVKEQRITTFMDECIIYSGAEGVALDNAIDVALVSLLLHLGIDSPILAAVSDGVINIHDAEGSQLEILGALIPVCCYVFYEIGKDPSDFMSRYRPQ